MRKKTFWIAGILLLFAVVLAACTDSSPAETERESISQFVAARFEYANEAGYKLITSEIGSLSTFDSLRLKPSQDAFRGDWIYRIIFQPNAIVPNSTEFVVLFGEENLSINGKTYVAEDGVDYADILNWVSGKYQFFDYELQHD